MKKNYKSIQIVERVDGKELFILKNTGEVILANNKRDAIRYFKADGLKNNYKVHSINVRKCKQ